MRKATCFLTPMVLWLGRNIYSFQLFKVHGFKNVVQAEIHAAEPLDPEASDSEFVLAIGQLISHKSPGSDQIQADLFKACVGTISLEIHKHIIFIL